MSSLPASHLNICSLIKNTFSRELEKQEQSHSKLKTADSDWQQPAALLPLYLASVHIVLSGMAFCRRGHGNKESSWWPKAQMILCCPGLVKTGDSLSFKESHGIASDRIGSTGDSTVSLQGWGIFAPQLLSNWFRFYCTWKVPTADINLLYLGGKKW